MAPPGWYPDPQDSQRLRYWDGYRWSFVTVTRSSRRAAPGWAVGVLLAVAAAGLLAYGVVTAVDMNATLDAMLGSAWTGGASGSAGSPVSPKPSPTPSGATTPTPTPSTVPAPSGGRAELMSLAGQQRTLVLDTAMAATPPGAQPNLDLIVSEVIAQESGVYLPPVSTSLAVDSGGVRFAVGDASTGLCKSEYVSSADLAAYIAASGSAAAQELLQPTDSGWGVQGSSPQRDGTCG